MNFENSITDKTRMQITYEKGIWKEQHRTVSKTAGSEQEAEERRAH